MNLTQYQARIAHQFAIYPGANEGNLLYPFVKLQAEILEYLEDPSVDEAGDILWYCCQLLTEMNVAAVDVMARSPHLSRSPLSALLAIAGNVGGFYRDGGAARHRAAIEATIGGVLHWLAGIEGDRSGISLEGMAIANVRKLEGGKGAFDPAKVAMRAVVDKKQKTA